MIMTNSFFRGPTPYKLVRFPDKDPKEDTPPGHQKYLPNHIHGTLFLILEVKSGLHVSTGVVVMGDDINRRSIPLIKTMMRGAGKDEELLIQGSSLKGCIRSIYEAITNSCVGVKPLKKNINKYPDQRLPDNDIKKLCPASIVFGASGDKWGWQGLVQIQDAHCEMKGYDVAFMPNLWSPQSEKNSNYYENDKTAGRKFYYHTKNYINRGEGNGIPAQIAAISDSFTTQLNFKNLKPEELGTLLIALGQDEDYPFALKLGAGKPIGMGTITVTVDNAEILQSQADLSARYTSLSSPQNQLLDGDKLTEFMRTQLGSRALICT